MEGHVPISDPSSLLWSFLTDEDYIAHHFKTSLHWRCSLKDILSYLWGPNTINREDMWLPKDSAANKLKKMSLALQLLRLFCILLLLMLVHVSFLPYHFTQQLAIATRLTKLLATAMFLGFWLIVNSCGKKWIKEKFLLHLSEVIPNANGTVFETKGRTKCLRPFHHPRHTGVNMKGLWSRLIGITGM